MNERFMEFFNDPSAYIKRLLQDSLDEKWNERSKSKIFSPCPFCDDADERCRDSVLDDCDACLCPPEICGKHGFDGMVDELLRIHDNDDGDRRNIICISHLREPELHGMLSLFKARLDNLDCRD